MNKKFIIIFIIFLLAISFFLFIKIDKENQSNIVIQEDGSELKKEIQELSIREPHEPPPALQEKAAIAILFEEDGKEKILYQKNIKEKLPIASLTKLMSAMIVIDKYPLDKEVTVSQRAVSTEGESGRLSPGEKISIENLLDLSLLVSSNDAAQALAEVIGEKKFVDLMNKKTNEIGLKNTHFANSHGLDAKGNFSTAEDLVLLTQYSILYYPKIWEILGMKEKKLIGKDNLGREIFHHPRNVARELLDEKSVIGAKTGYTEDAGETIILTARAPGNPKGNMVIVILGVGIGERIQKAKELYDWVLKAFRWE